MIIAKLRRLPKKILEVVYAWNDFILYARGIGAYCCLAESML